MESESGNTLYQPLDSSMAGVNCSDGTSSGQGSGGGIDRHKQPASSDGSPAPLIQGGSGRGCAPFDVSSESGGGSDGEGGLKSGKPVGGPSKKTISFWVSVQSIKRRTRTQSSVLRTKMCPIYIARQTLNCCTSSIRKRRRKRFSDTCAEDATSRPMAVWALVLHSINPTSPRLTSDVCSSFSSLVMHVPQPVLLYQEQRTYAQ